MPPVHSNVKVCVSTWNIAAVNNNPFEYWVTYPDAAYNDFMRRVEQIIASQDELVVNQIFTESMFSELIDELKALDFGGLEPLRLLWRQDLSCRSAITGFLKDKALGEKRLTRYSPRRFVIIKHTY